MGDYVAQRVGFAGRHDLHLLELSTAQGQPIRLTYYPCHYTSQHNCMDMAISIFAAHSKKIDTFSSNNEDAPLSFGLNNAPKHNFYCSFNAALLNYAAGLMQLKIFAA